MKFLLTLLFSFLVFFHVSAQINGSSTGTVGQCSTYSLGTWPAVPGDQGNACMSLYWGLSGGGSIGQNNTSVQACWTSSGWHTVTLSDDCGRSASLQVYVSCAPVTITPSTTTACIGQQVNLSASGYTSYSWSGASGNGSSATFTPTSVGSHTVSVTGTTGSCTTTSSVTIQVNPPASISSPTTIQLGQSTQLCATGGTSYLWSNGSTSSCINVSPSAITSYSVQVTTPCGSTNLSTNVTVTGVPLSINANNVCTGQSIQANANGGTAPYSFSASIPISSQNGALGVANLAPSSAGNVTITVTDAAGASASKTVSVTQTPSFSLSAANTHLCVGQSTTISVVGGNADNYTWQIISGNGNISGGGTSVTITPSSSVAVQVTGTKNGCSFTATQSILLSIGQVAISTASTNLCGTSEVIMYGSGANSYTWAVNGTPYGGSSVLQLSISQPTTVTLTGIDNCGSTSSASVEFSISSPIDLVVTPEINNFLLGDDVTFTASSAETLTYTWYNEDMTQQLGTGATFTTTPTQNTTYTLVASNGVCEVVKQVRAVLIDESTVFCSPFKKQTFESIPTENYSVPNPDYDKNYIRSETMLTPVKTQTEIDALPINNNGKAVAFGFFDGLGRDEQTVQLEASPNKNNIIQHIEYDEFGRMPKGFLPHTGINSVNPFQQNAGTQQAYFYVDIQADYARTKIPYSEKIFENSPYSRVLEQAAQGEAYSLQTGKTIKATERPNTYKDFVHQWYYDAVSQRLKSDNFYADGELWVNETEDEHQTKTWQFTDKLGRLILQRTEVEENKYNNGAPVETYYVYHKRFLKKPQFIIQPEGVVNRYGIEVVYLTLQELNNWTFRYQYDGRGRVHKKWIPGQKGESTFIYDERDRMILAQTPNQKQQYEWTFTKYDALNRPIMSGLYKSNKTVAELQSEIEAQAEEDMYEYRERDIPFGYSNISFPILNGTRQVLSVIYYDGYCDIFDEEANAETFLFAANPLVLEEEQAAIVRGLTTVSKTRVLDDSREWLSSVIYYDDYHRSIQTQTQQTGGDWDIMTNKYDFSGKVLQTYQEHQSQIEPVIVQQGFKYDHAGRLLQTYHQVNQEQAILLSNVRYNEVGQVKGKGLHQAIPLQDITFQYNIRGWLTHINELENVQLGNPNKLFAFQIQYDEAGQYNGNIGTVQWKTVTDAVERGYGFSYDKLNRLKYAKYFNDGTSRYEDENYTVSNIEYDQNGNIFSLARNGLLKMHISEQDPTQIEKAYGEIDNLYYSYNNGNSIRSNRLINVSDYAGQNSGIAGDFQDRNTSSQADYKYDLSGNLISDKNKGIYKIIYNHLNLPERIVFETGNQIFNTYDAAGIKLKSEIVEQGVVLRTTHYKNGFIYEQKNTEPTLQLSFFGTAEGRIVKKEERFVYEYHYKDHLGNLRVAFQAKEDQESERYSLTMEADSSKKEEAEFENVAAARSDQKDKEGHYSAELENSKQPISKTIKVKKGDQIKASVFATHDPAIAETDPTKVIAEAKKDVLLSLGGVVAGSINPTPIEQKIEIPLNPEISPAQTIIVKTPKVQLNLLDFVPVIRNLRALNQAKKAKGLEPDMYFVPKGELVLELKDSLGNLIEEKRHSLSMYSSIAWEELVSDFDISQDGNLKIYIDNGSSDKVFFDEFIIERTEATVAVVVQENHYYPFGMNMKGIEELDLQSIDGNDEHRWQYNGVEKNESFDLNWNETFYRTYDYQLGRWTAVDSKPTYEHTTYMGMGNNPMKYSDVLGDTIRLNDAGYDDLVYEGAWENTVNEALDKLRSTEEGEAFYQELQQSEYDFTITWTGDGKNSANPTDELGATTEGVGSGGIIRWDPTSDEGGEMSFEGKQSRPSEIGLAHELFGHGLQYKRGTIKRDTYLQNTENAGEEGSYNEVDASHRENIIRSAMGMPLRTHYDGRKPDPQNPNNRDKDIRTRINILQGNPLYPNYNYQQHSPNNED